jgi:2-methylcitrate dehydratase PrpD
MLKSAGAGEASLLGLGVRTEPLKAALINGIAGTCLELDEGNHFARGHPAVHVLPACLALSEQMRLSGKDLLTAFVLGYDICSRIGIACKIRKSMHPHGTWGTVGAAVGVGKLLGYTEGRMREIVNVSADLSLATSRRTMLEGGTVRNAYAGMSGYLGLLSHELVSSEFTGEIDALRTIFGSVVSETFVPEAITEDLGGRFEVSRNYFKEHACGRYCHSVLGALAEIMAQRSENRIRPYEVEAVEIETYSLAAQLSKQEVRNAFAAKFSIPFAAATFIVNGSAGIDSFRFAAVGSREVLDLVGRVRVHEDPRLTALWPGQRVARVSVRLRDGTVLKAESLVDKGDSEDPYSAEELRRKFYDLAVRIMEVETVGTLYTDLMQLEQFKDINRITDLLRRKVWPTVGIGQ